MARAGPGNDEERLPWLEPYRATVGNKAAPVAAHKRGTRMAIGGVAALAVALTAGYYIGQRDPRLEAPPVAIALAPVSPAPVAQTPPNPPPPIAEVVSPIEADAAPVGKKGAVSMPSKPVRRTVRQQKVRNAGIESIRQKQVRAAQRRASAARRAARAWPKMPSPGPAGQVIQLGAFRNPAGANRAYRTRLARYPSLGSMPRVVVPVATKPGGQILYALRLGTTSRQQSRVVCRNLKVGGDHCLVIG